MTGARRCPRRWAWGARAAGGRALLLRLGACGEPALLTRLRCPGCLLTCLTTPPRSFENDDKFPYNDGVMLWNMPHMRKTNKAFVDWILGQNNGLYFLGALQGRVLSPPGRHSGGETPRRATRLASRRPASCSTAAVHA